MILILLIVFALMFIFKLKILKFEKINNVRNLWTIYFTTITAELLSLIGVGLYYDEFLGISTQGVIWLILLFICVILECIILLIVGIAANVKQKKIIKENNIEVIKSKYTFLQLLFTFICVWGILFLCLNIPKIFKSDVEIYAEEYVLEYMNNKYGDEGNFKIYNIAKDYDSEGEVIFEREEHTGFIVDLKTDYVPNIITVKLYGTTKDEFHVSYDDLFQEYYDVSGYEFYILKEEKKNEKVEKDFKDNFNINIDAKVDIISSKIPDDYGKIPTMDEYIDLIKIDTENMDISILDKVEVENRLDYLKNLAQFSISYFGEEKNIKINFSFNRFYDKGIINVENNDVTININNEVTVYPKSEIMNLNNN